MFVYAIKSAIYLSIMYIPYMLMLRKESFFTFNRILLLCIMVLSLVLPLCNVHLLAWNENPIHQGMIEVGMPIAVMEGTTAASTATDALISWIAVLFYAYLIGAGITFIYKVIQFIRLYRLIHNGVLWKEHKNGVTIYCHAHDIASFSWFHTIVLSENDYKENATEILRHEMGHIMRRHSWDIMLLNVVETIQWCNPLVWILASSLRDVHEYEADDAVLRSGVNARQYQTLLIRKAVGSSSYTFANSFNHSLLKKRITMMLKKRSNPWMRTKALYIIPVAVIALSAFATPELNNRVDAIAEQAPSVIADKGTTNSAIVQEKEKENLAETANEPASIGNLIPADDNDESGCLYFLNGKEISRDELDGMQPSKIVEMTIIKKEEDISKYTSKKGITAVILVSTKDGESESTATTSANKAFDVVEQMPQFPGGGEAMMKFVSENMKYPDEAKKQGLCGRVVVEFTVEEDGTITGVKTKSFRNTSSGQNAKRKSIEVGEGFATAAKEATVAKEVTINAYADAKNAASTNKYVQAYNTTKLLTDEAERVVKSMPKWEPGTQGGKPVRVHFYIPITFNNK